MPTDNSTTIGPAASPELPITIHLDGGLGAVEFVRRLHRGGLELRNAEDGSDAVIVRAERERQTEATENAIGEHIERQRRRLNKASAVLLGAELTAEYNPEMSIVTDAIS